MEVNVYDYICINADKIIVIDTGRVVETGTQDELFTQNVFYANLYNSQFKKV